MNRILMFRFGLQVCRVKSPRSRNGSGFTLVELLVVIAIIGVLVSLLLPAVQAAREAARRMQCTNNLKQIGLALHNYESTNKKFPFGKGPSYPGAPVYARWSQHAFILPYIEQQNLYNTIDFDYPPWHTDEDTIDKLSAQSLEIVGSVVTEVIRKLERQ